MKNLITISIVLLIFVPYLFGQPQRIPFEKEPTYRNRVREWYETERRHKETLKQQEELQHRQMEHETGLARRHRGALGGRSILRQEPIIIQTFDPQLQTAVNRLISENQEDLKRIKALEDTIKNLESKLHHNYVLERAHWTKVNELEKKVKLLCRAELKRRNSTFQDPNGN